MDTGARLREAREARGLTLESLSRATRVQPRVLAAIERNDVAALPPRPYGRSFVRSYASEVGLDPEATTREFFLPFAPAVAPAEAATPARPPRAAEARRWAWPVGAVLGYAAVGAFVIVVGSWAIRSQAGAPESSAPPAPVPVATSGRTEAAPVAARPSGVTVALEAQRPVWVTAAVDGERQVYRTLLAGERVSLKGLREVAVRVGDAGALLWQVNGRSAEAMGRPGEVRTVRLTADAERRTPDAGSR